MHFNLHSPTIDNDSPILNSCSCDSCCINNAYYRSQLKDKSTIIRLTVGHKSTGENIININGNRYNTYFCPIVV